MKKNAFLFLFFAFCLLVGGVIGFIKAGSKASLVASLSFSIPLIVSSLCMFTQSIIAEYCSFVLVLGVDALFWWRYYSTGNFMPAGLLLIISTLVLVCAYFNFKKRLSLNT